jgi:transposase-like protein
MIEKKFLYSLAEKLNIVKESYTNVGGKTAVSQTARKYQVQSQQIRTWKKNFLQASNTVDSA